MQPGWVKETGCHTQAKGWQRAPGWEMERAPSWERGRPPGWERERGCRRLARERGMPQAKARASRLGLGPGGRVQWGGPGWATGSARAGLGRAAQARAGPETEAWVAREAGVGSSGTRSSRTHRRCYGSRHKEHNGQVSVGHVIGSFLATANQDNWNGASWSASVHFRAFISATHHWPLRFVTSTGSAGYDATPCS